MKNYLKRTVALATITMSMMALNPIGASAEWRKDNKGSWYAEGNSWATGWRDINGKWYYFDFDGYMLHDTSIEGYNLGSDGAWINEEKEVETIALTKKDFEVNIDGNKINLIDYWSKFDWWNCTGYVGEPNEDDDKTYRNIKLRDSLNNVLNLYGSASVSIIDKNDVFYKYPNYEKNPAIKHLKYKYLEGNNEYNVKFYFNESDQLVLIVFVKNEKNNSSNVYKNTKVLK